MTLAVDEDRRVLGRQVAANRRYDPAILHAIPRALGRSALGIAGTLPFHGEDVWHAYELSWLERGRPVIALGQFAVAADSPNLVESKSLKLYLNSLNETDFESKDALVATVEGDVSSVLGGPAKLQIFDLEDPAMAPAPLEHSVCVDREALAALPAGPDPEYLSTGPQIACETLHSHLLRSLCPVTAQPDWATVLVDYEGPRLNRSGLLSYLLGFRQHQGFHEQCVEQIFVDILARCAPSALTVQALYTRRGGLDICPWRSLHPGTAPRLRLQRQ